MYFNGVKLQWKRVDKMNSKSDVEIYIQSLLNYYMYKYK